MKKQSIYFLVIIILLVQTSCQQNNEEEDFFNNQITLLEKRPFTNTLCGVTFVPENRKITCPFRNLCSFLASSGVPDLPPAASFWE